MCSHYSNSRAYNYKVSSFKYIKEKQALEVRGYTLIVLLRLHACNINNVILTFIK